MPTILVVDDEGPVRVSLIITLERMFPSFTMAEAETIEAGITKAREIGAELTLVILDGNTKSQMTGLQGAPIIRDLCPKAKIIILSGNQTEEFGQEAERVADLFLEKPVGPKVFINEIKRLLSTVS